MRRAKETKQEKVATLPASKGKKGNGRTEKTTNSKGRTTSKSQTSKARASKEPSSKRAPAPKNKNTAQANAKTEENAIEKKSIIGRAVVVLKKRKKDLQRENSPALDEFRYNIETQHMNYLFEKKDEEYRSIGFTTDEKTFGINNMPLEKNPKKGDTQLSYVRNGIIEGTRHSYSKKKAKNYSLSGDDKANVKSKIRNYKKNRKKTK